MKFSNIGYYPLHIAALNNRDKIIEYLSAKDESNMISLDLECGTDVECTALHLAAKNGHVKSVRMLLNLGANIYAKDRCKWTALHYAAFKGRAKVV